MGANKTTTISAAIAEYERFRLSQGIARSTIRNHRTTLTRFNRTTGDLYVHSINDVHVTRFFEELSLTKQAHSQLNDHAALKGFFDWCRHKRYMARDNDPLALRRKPKKKTRERNRLHVSKFPALLDAAQARSDRDRIGVAILLYTLMRDQEVADLRIRDLELDDGFIIARIHKTNEEDRVPICAELDEELRRWLTHYTEQVGVLLPHYYLVPSRETKPVVEGGQIVANETVRLKPERKTATLGRMVTPALEAIGFPLLNADGTTAREGSHTLRRSGARALFDRLVTEGYDGALRVVMSLLHHKSVRTTELYLGLSADRKTRDDLIRGRRLYDVGESVVPMRRSGDGDEAGRSAVV